MTKRRGTFQPNAPSKGVWLAGVILGGLGILAHFVSLGDLSAFNYWLLLLGFFLLVVGTSYRQV